MTITRFDALIPIRSILAEYWRASKWTLLAVALVVSLSSISAVAAPYIFSRLIDRLQTHDAVETLLGSFILYGVLLGVTTLLRHWIGYLTFLTSESLNYISAVTFFDRILKKQSDFFVDHNAAEIQSAQARGQGALNGFVQMGLAVVIPNIVQIGLAIATLGAIINMDIAVIVLVYGIAFVSFTYLANRWTDVHLREATASLQENAKFLGNAMNTMETLRLFQSEDWLKSRFSHKACEARASLRRFSLKRIGMSSFYGLALGCQFAITFALLLPQFHAGKLSIGNVVLFNTLLLQLNQPFEMVGQAIDNFVRLYSQFLPFLRMWLAKEEGDLLEVEPADLYEGRICLEGVGFAYSNGRGVTNVTFCAERGKLTFLTGPTGSGKSTIFRLLLKSLAPTAGRILVDEMDLGNLPRRRWLSRIGVVPQDVVLLNDTLRSNIILGRDHNEDRLRRVAEKAAVLRVIDALPEGFDTVVGERGLKLSGGERQRIAIARALYGKPEFLFLDEASSALDEATEKAIMEHVRQIANEVTVLAITHRKTVITGDDDVICLHNGPRPSPQ